MSFTSTKVSGVPNRPGHAIIEIGYALAVDKLRFTLQRTASTDTRYLGGDGRWHDELQRLEPESVERRGSTTLIGVGPSVVDRLPEDIRVRITIVSTTGPEEAFADSLFWQNVPPSSGGVGASVFTPRAKPAPEPPVDTDMGDGRIEPTLGTPEPEVLPDTDVVQTHEEPPPPKRGLDWRILAGLGVLLLILLAGAGYAAWHYKPELTAWLWPEPKKPEQEQTGPNPPVKPTEEVKPPEETKVNPPVNDKDKEPPRPPVGEDLRLRKELEELVKAKDGDPGRILDGARRLIDSPQPEMREYGFRALDEAAARGSASAQFEMGRLFDPRYFKLGRGGMDKPNVLTALDFYQKAKKGGSPEADNEIKSLCERLSQPLGEIDEQTRKTAVSQYCN